MKGEQEDGAEYRHVLNSGAGPIRATRAALGGLGSAQEVDKQDLCIDNRKIKSSS